MEIEVPQDRRSTFEPQVVKKRQKDISDIDQKIISMYAKGMTTRQISDTIEDIYVFETSECFISDVTYKILPQIEDWQNRPLDEVYPILYIDAIHYSVRDNGVIRKLAAYVILGISTFIRRLFPSFRKEIQRCCNHIIYKHSDIFFFTLFPFYDRIIQKCFAAYVILGINAEGKKEVLTISIGENESSKYWLSVLNELKNRGVKDILIICADGLTGIKEAIAAAFPKTEYQRCIAKYWLSVLNELKNRGVKDILIICADGLTGIKEAIAAAFPKTEYQRCIAHQVRNTLRYVPDKDRKAFATCGSIS